MALRTTNHRIAYVLATSETTLFPDVPKLQAAATAIGQLGHNTGTALERAAASGDPAAASKFVRVVEHFMNHKDDGTPKRPDRPIQVNAEELLSAAAYRSAYRALTAIADATRDALDTALRTDDYATAAELLSKVDVDPPPLGLGWTCRLYRNIPQTGNDPAPPGVAPFRIMDARVDPARKMDQLRKELMAVTSEIRDQTTPVDLTAQRRHAADLFAQIVNLRALYPKRAVRGQAFSLSAMVEELAEIGVPGCLPVVAPYVTELPELDIRVTTRLRLYSPAIQAVGLAWQLERRGLDPSYFRRDDAMPEIQVAEDRRFLGKPDAPVGFLTEDRRFVVVPDEIWVRIMQHEELYGGRHHITPLGHFGVPSGDFYLESSRGGTALRLPVTIDLRGDRLELSYGRFVARSGASVTARADGTNLSLTVGPPTDARIEIDITTGRVIQTRSRRTSP